MLFINTKIKNLKKAYVTYQLRDADGKIYYIGTCRLNRITELPDASRHPQFKYHFSNNKPVAIEGVFISESLADCHVKRLELIDKCFEKPIMNQIDKVGMHGIPITCIETGEVFPTLQAVVDKHGVTLSALSKHLNHEPKHNTVRGRTYKRGK